MSAEPEDVAPHEGEMTEGTDAAGAPSWIPLVIVGAMQFMIVLDATVVNVAAPSIQSSLDFTAGGLQWIVTAYTLLASGFTLLGGRAGDLVGRRLVFLVGTALFTVASLCNGLAPTATVLIVGRGAQGLGAALASAAGLAVLLAAFPGARARSRALAVWTSIAVAGGAAGVLIGGVLTQWLSWPWVFYINVPIGVLAILAGLRWLPESRDATGRRRFDVLGAITVTLGSLLMVYAITEAPDLGWSAPGVVGTGIAGLVLLALFVVVERRSSDPLVRLDAFRIRSLSIGNLALMLVGGATFSLFLFVSLYIQEILGYDPLRAGLAFLPVFAASVVGAFTAQQLIRRIGTRAVAVAGLALGAIGMVWLLRLPAGGSYLTDLLGPLVVGSIGLGIATVPLTLLATSGLPAELAGLASGINNASQNLGRALGLAILTTVEVTATTNALQTTPDPVDAQLAGYHAGFLGAAILLALGIALVVALLRRRHTVAIDLDAQAPNRKNPVESVDSRRSP